MSPKWLLESDDQPEWMERFQQASDGSKREFEYVHWLKLNQSQPVYVPADVSLRLRFETPYDDKWVPWTTDHVIKLQHRELLELGDVQFQPSLPASVRVTDMDGTPVEGVPIRSKHHGGRGWSIAHNTDKEGRAFFYVYPKSKGRFWVSNIPGPDGYAKDDNLYADFEIGERAPESDYKIVITEKQVTALLGKDQRGPLPKVGQ